MSDKSFALPKPKTAPQPTHGEAKQQATVYKILLAYDEFEDKVTSMTPGEEIAIEFVRHGTLHRVVLLALPYGLKKEIEA